MSDLTLQNTDLEQIESLLRDGLKCRVRRVMRELFVIRRSLLGIPIGSPVHVKAKSLESGGISLAFTGAPPMNMNYPGPTIAGQGQRVREIERTLNSVNRAPTRTPRTPPKKLSGESIRFRDRFRDFAHANGLLTEG